MLLQRTCLVTIIVYSDNTLIILPHLGTAEQWRQLQRHSVSLLHFLSKIVGYF